MAYSSGMLNKRVTVARRVTSENRSFGDGGEQYEVLGTFWAAEDFSKGLKALREGALDAYDTVMFRMRYNADIDRWCLLQYLGKWYQIISFNESYQENQIQITAQEMANQYVNLAPTPSEDESLPLSPSQGGGNQTEDGGQTEGENETEWGI